MDESTAQALVAGGGDWTLSAYDSCPNPPAYQPDHPDRTYYTTQLGIPLKADEYDPTPGYPGQTFPALVMVHGGGGFRGCKWMMSQNAYELSHGDPYLTFAQQYIVFAIDYRLACLIDDPNLALSPIHPYCGYLYFPADIEPNPMDGVSYGPGIHDVEQAMHWVKSNANTYCNCWNNKVVMLGSSWGGNLGFMASWRLGSAHADQVKAIGAWSGALEVQKQQPTQPPNNKWPCADASQTSDTYLCQGGTNQYLGCMGAPYPNTNCLNNPPNPPTYGLYAHASPYSKFGAGLGRGQWPVAFFSNGGFGSSGPELQSAQSQTDFASWLGGQSWSIGSDYYVCSVDTNLHAQSYVNQYRCHEDTSTNKVIQTMVAFWFQYMG